MTSHRMHAEELLPEKNKYIAGWYQLDPYQYVKNEENQRPTLTGLDVELVREIFKILNKEVVYNEVSWRQHQLDLKSGKRDLAAGATFTQERSEYVYFSKPYRFEENSLFVRRGEEGVLQFEGVSELLRDIKLKSFRLGVVDGFIYADPRINEWVSDPDNQALINPSADDYGSLKKLLNGEIDGFLADRLVGATAIWRQGLGKQVNEVVLGLKTPIHLMFSKKTVSPAMVEKFNQAIDMLHESKAYNKIVSWYLHPILLLQTVDALWFRIVEFIGTIAFAISGLVIAYRDRATLFGTFVLALLPSMGGGIVRDVIFDRFPIGAIEYPSYLYAVMLTVLIGFFVIRVSERYGVKPQFLEYHRNWQSLLLGISDTLGLSAFTVSGIVVSVMVRVEPLWLWGPVFALVTGVGGGILRDLLSKQREIMSLKGILMPEIVVVWGFFLSLFLIYQSQNVETRLIKWAVIITVAGVFLTRVVVQIFKVPNLYFRKPAD
ncbi:MAG: transporter substrate-binding domain-containing protein [Myxococcales bacterium]|nr:MAG: transporter substrate-binding domain-containing protein [Myxococcales bacterium]